MEHQQRSEGACHPTSMNTNAHEAPPENAGVRMPVIRAALAGFAVIGFLALGFLFLQSMRARDWPIAISTVVGALSVIPWASYRSTTRDCFAGTVALAAGAFCGIGAVIVYLGMFHYEWFSDVFDHKGIGPIGMFLFAALGFSLGAYATLHTMIRLLLPTSVRCSDFLTSCFSSTSTRNET
ncbi:hypothetical protein K239x_30190 [Planctomycetes bacterium K23_9]|uniref:Uncharacterized protein n=1 Tax=Stieleria marina TaxID=1930275 RepID=A0A517NV75_9BACT|nr:hypothetical protein K239x_30190 [Planctomycetes bacterium K23_9]